jgi:hypothetical protein
MAMVLDTGLMESLVETRLDERNGVVSGRALAGLRIENTEEQFEIYVAPPRKARHGRFRAEPGLWAPDGQGCFRRPTARSCPRPASRPRLSAGDR